MSRFINGFSQVLGEVPMLQNPQHSEDEVRLMKEWILALVPKKPSTSLNRGLKGGLTIPHDPNVASCVIETTYSDLGKELAKPLTGFHSLKFFSNRMEAESAAIVGPNLFSLISAYSGHVVNRIEPGR